MIVETNDLTKISTYARDLKVSVTWINKLANEGKLDLIVIDGIRFIKTKK